MEEAWRIVDPVLKADTPVYEYEKGAWGPREVNQTITPPGAGIILRRRNKRTAALRPTPADAATIWM